MRTYNARTLNEILLDQRQLVDAEWDELELRQVITNPQTLVDMGTLESWEY